MSDTRQPGSLTGFEVAVIGMAGRFPGADNIETFWQNLKNGVEPISFFSDEELGAAGIEPALMNNPNYVRAGGILPDIERFDAAFFGYNPKEAEVMDPQQRLFLEVAWAALEDAGYDSNTYDGLIGTFAGAGTNTYVFNLYSNCDISESIGGFEALIGNASDHLCTRTSYQMNLEGPAVAVQTACSTSLVAVHIACQSLISGDCDMALAGGVSLHIPQRTGHLTQAGWIISPDGHCRAFDDRARGTANGSGVGIVVLKRLDDAIAEGDCIQAVIKGSAINNDGARRIGYTAPRVEGQAKVIRAAQLMAEVDAGSIGYIETHGTGTELGDPIEIIALTRAFRETTDKRGFCAIGSVKTNFGHLDTGAGVTGLIKAILCLKHRQLPPSLHFETPNAKIDFENSPFYVNHQLREWEAAETPRRAGVSSFGMGGTNAHVILEETPVTADPGESGRPCLLLLSAKTPRALDTVCERLVTYFKNHPGINLTDAAYTLQVGRRPLSQRRILVCRDAADAVTALEDRDPKRVFSSAQEQEDRPVVFMFPGQGAQYVNMGRELHRVEPVFREEMERCFEILKPITGFDLKEILYPPLSTPVGARRADPGLPHHSALINETSITQPALFVVEYALARLLMSYGIKPQAMAGHSIGEYVAACLSGVFSLEDALMLVTLRGRLMQTLPGGSMLGVPLPEMEVQPKLTADLSIAAVNGAKLCVVSGPTAAVEALQRQLTDKGVNCSRLHTSHAFHSVMMEPVMASFADQIKNVKLYTPTIPYLSNLTGAWIGAEDTTNPDYWVNHLRRTVRFADNLAELLKNPEWLLLEIGPGRSLSTLAKQHRGKEPGQVILSTLRHPQEPQPDEEFLFNTLGRLWLAGAKIDWYGVHAHERRRRLSLPTYPFEGKRYWVALKKRESAAQPEPVPVSKKTVMADWFYQPVWQRAEHPAAGDGPEETVFLPGWIIFSDSCGLGDKIAALLKEDDQDVTIVRQGDRFQNPEEGVYNIDPKSAGDYQTLFGQLAEAVEPPWKIAHFWGVTTAGLPPAGRETFEKSQYSGFYSLLFLAQAVGKLYSDIGGNLQITVISDHMQKVADDEILFPEKATVLAPCKVIPKEYPGITCRSIDVLLPEAGSEKEKQLIGQLIKELSGDSRDPIVAFREGQRLVQTFEPVRLTEPEETGAGLLTAEGRVRLRKGGTYLITGGLGGMGLTFSQYLARDFQAKLVLIDRLALPERDDWQQWLAERDGDEMVIRKIKAVQALEEAGAEVMTSAADAADEPGMKEIIDRARERFGPIHGVIHTAGIAGGGMIRLRTREAAEEVFAPKVTGLYVLDTLLRQEKPDFIVLCSSLTSILGEYGQVDYCAANIFLDAYAWQHTTSGEPFTLSINWDTWKDLGMAVDAAARIGSAGTSRELQIKIRDIAHPLLDLCREEADDRVVYTASLSVTQHWPLQEHRLNGMALLPGTAYIEMVRAAFADHTGSTAVEIGEITFIAPMLVPEEEIQHVHTVLTKKNGGHEFIIKSRPESQKGDESSWLEHARGTVRQVDTAPAGKRNIKDMEEQCGQPDLSSRVGKPQEAAAFKELGPLTFGPRWQHLLKRAGSKENRAIAHLELPENFSDDLQHYGLHPALLDAAAGFAAVNKGAYLPFSYKNIKIHRPMPRKVVSYSEWQETGAPQNATLHLRVSVMDSQGHVLIEIEDYTLRKVAKNNQTLYSKELSYRLEIVTPGILDTLTLRPEERRQPGPGEVQIKVNTVALNFKDVLMALTMQTGNLSDEVTRFGSECVGEITAVGEGVTDLKVGKNVIAVAPACFCTYLTTSASFVVPMLPRLSIEEAATIPIAFMTALYALYYLGRLRKGEKVLIHAAAGGVGQAAVQLAQQTGAEIFATAGSPEKREFLKSLGIPHVMNSRTLDFAGEIMEYTGGAGVDVVLNSLAGKFMIKSLESLAPFGRFLEIGKRDIYREGQMSLKPFRKGLAFFSVNLSPQLPTFRDILLEVIEACKGGTLKPLPYKVFPLREVKQAFDYLAQAKHIGKIVISMQDREAAVAAASAREAGQPVQKARSAVSPAQVKTPGKTLINLENGISSREGLAIFKRVLGGSLPQVIVSTRDLRQRLKQQESPGTTSPAGQHERPALQTAYAAPRNETERLFTTIWQEVLGINKVGIHDNFFDLGGASLQSIQVVARAKESGIVIAPELLFEFQTIAEIIEALPGKTQADQDE